MGRADPDLPDPLENQEGAATGGADDLLSQLAGDEIDRLLAEADVEAAPPPQPDAAADAAADAAVAPIARQTEPPAAEAPPEPSLDAQLNDLFNALNESTPAASAADAAPGAPAEPAAVAPAAPVASDLDEQLAKLANELLPATEAEQALVAAEAPAAPAAAAAAERAQESPVADERAALLAESPESDEGEEGAVDDADAPAPWYLLPLVWLNAPFASLSDGAREVIGKVALATLLFSITVLTFLAVTRHKL